MIFRFIRNHCAEKFTNINILEYKANFTADTVSEFSFLPQVLTEFFAFTIQGTTLNSFISKCIILLENTVLNYV